MVVVVVGVVVMVVGVVVGVVVMVRVVVVGVVVGVVVTFLNIIHHHISHYNSSTKYLLVYDTMTNRILLKVGVELNQNQLSSDAGETDTGI